MNTMLHKRWWFRILVFIAILILLVITMLPYGIRHVMQNWMMEHGADSAVVENVDINLFTGVVQIVGVSVERGGQQTLKLDRILVRADWLPLFKKRSFFPALEINGLNLLIEKNSSGVWRIGGIQPPAPETQPEAIEEEDGQEPWGFGLRSIVFNNSEITYQSSVQKNTVAISEITLDKLESWSQDSTHIEYQGKLNQSAISLVGDVAPFAKQPDFQGRLKIEDFDLASLGVYLTQLTDIQGQFSVDSQLSVKRKSNQHLLVKADPNVQLNNLILKTAGQSITHDKLSWQGKLVAETSPDQPPSYTLDGQLSSENLDVKPDAIHLYHHDQLHWNGSIASLQQSAVPSIKGQLRGKDMFLQHLPSGQQLFRSGSLSVDSIDVQGLQQIKTGNIVLTDLHALFKPASEKEKQLPAMAHAVELSITGASAKDLQQIRLGKINMKGALLYAHLLENGNIQHLAALEQGGAQQASAQPESAQSKTAPAEKSNQPVIAIEEVALTDNSRIRVFDESVDPDFDTELLIEKAVISDLDSGQPSKSSPFILEGKTDKYSNLQFEGHVSPFSKPIDLSLKGTVSQVSLPVISAYASKAIGYDLTSGQLNANIKVEIKKGEIDAMNELVISNLAVKASDDKKAAQLAKQISMPLDSALSLLRNKNNDIKLEIPVKGNVNKPEFKLNDVINTAIGTALRKASLSYLKYALQPYGSLITLVQLASKAANYVSLTPVIFDAGEPYLNASARDYAIKIASLMNERPGLRLRLCAHAVPADREKLIADKQAAWQAEQQKKIGENGKLPPQPTFTVTEVELSKLATQRADAVKEVLVKQHSIAGGRLFICKPEIDDKADAQPRLEIGI